MMKNMRKILSLFLAVQMAAAMSVTAHAADYDSKFTDNTLSKDDLTAYYKVENADNYIDVTAVYVAWDLPVVKCGKNGVTSTSWNTETLKWTKSDETLSDSSEFAFYFYNVGSKTVKAKVSFAPEESLKDVVSVNFGTTNEQTINSIVKDDHTLKVTRTEEQSDKDFENAIKEICQADISGTVSISDESKLSASGKLGTYTLSIRNTEHTVTVKYYADSEASDLTMENITVDDGATITFTGTTVTINGTTYTTANGSWQVNSESKSEGTITVSSDLEITAVTSA